MDEETPVLAAARSLRCNRSDEQFAAARDIAMLSCAEEVDEAVRPHTHCAHFWFCKHSALWQHPF